MIKIPHPDYILVTDINRHGQKIHTLYKIAVSEEGKPRFAFSEPTYIHEWESDSEPTREMIDREIMLNDYSRWNKGLQKDAPPVEVSESVYYDMMGAVPPHYMTNNYFEVGEAHHHENGKPIYRAFWIENTGNGYAYFTGYPKPEMHTNN